MKERDLFDPPEPAWKTTDDPLLLDEILKNTTKEARIAVEKAAIIIAPLPTGDGGFAFGRDSLEFAKRFVGEEPGLAVAWDEKRQTIHLHAAEIWLVGLVILKNIGIGVVTSLIATYLREKLGKKVEGVVHLDISSEEGGKKRRIKYDGPATALLADIESGKFVARITQDEKKE